MADAPCEVADEALPAGWRCANPECRATTASKRRGPRKEFCSKSQCKDLATKASAAVKEGAKDRRIAELEAKVSELTTSVVLLKEQLARAQRSSGAADEHPRRRPLAAVSGNVQAQAKAQPECAPAKKPRAAVAPAEQQTPPLPPGWVVRPSRTRPGKLSYEQDKYNFLSTNEFNEPPRYHLPGATFTFPVCFLGGLEQYVYDSQSYEELCHGEDHGYDSVYLHINCPSAKLAACWEDCFGMSPGSVLATAALRTAFADGCAELDREDAVISAQFDIGMVRKYFEQTVYGEAGLKLDDATFWAQMNKNYGRWRFGMQRLQVAVGALVKAGHLYNTIDDEHYAALTRLPAARCA